MKRFNLDWEIVKYGIITLIDLILSISGLTSVLTIYKLYETTLLFYFLLYNIIISIFGIFHFIKVFRDMLKEKIKDELFVKIKLILMLTSFIWGIVILENKHIMTFYQNNYSRVYVTFIIFFIMSTLTILDVVYKIIKFLTKKKDTSFQEDIEFLIKLEHDFKHEIINEEIDNL